MIQPSLCGLAPLPTVGRAGVSGKTDLRPFIGRAAVDEA